MSDIDEIKSRLDIVDVVSGYVSLQKSGRSFKARCPFHAEKTPSFIVNPERQAWRCFGACATGGDAFSFVMRAERLDFGETLRLLAQKAGVSLAQRRDGGRLESLYRVNQEAARFYQDILASSQGRRGMDYLEERGVDSKAMAAFGLGLSPAGSDGLKSQLSSLGFDLDHATEAGLLRRMENGSVRDFFWGRLMFPIHDRQGRTIGFGARSLDGSDPKYLNTPSTPVFDKRATLYGLHMAAGPIKDEGAAVVVEGYMDTIAAHQHGYNNVVASMGTALTELQVSQLKSMARRFVQALDPDAAGQEATRRSLESSWSIFERQRVDAARRSVGPLYQREPLSLSIASLPAGRDPDDVIRQDPGEWERLIKDAVPYMDFALPAFASKYDLSSDLGKAQAAEALLPLVTATENAIEQERYFRRLAEVLGVSTEALEASIGKPRAGGQARARYRDRPGPTPAPTMSPLAGDSKDFLEDYILALLLRRPELREHAESLAPERFHRAENREVFTSWQSCSTIDELTESLDDTLHEHVGYLAGIDLVPSDGRAAKTALDQSLRRLEQRYLQEHQELLLVSGEDTLPPSIELEQEIVRVNTRLKELFSQKS